VLPVLLPVGGGEDRMEATAIGGREGGAEAYDVFVSYRHQDPDGAWVRGVLEIERNLPRLIAAIHEPSSL
jgi:hypothetical protein